MNKKIQVVIAIDPDVDRNGVAYIDLSQPDRALQLSVLEFPLLIETLRNLKNLLAQSDKTYRVLIEAGWLNHGNWHLNPRDSKAVIAAKGNHAGRNQETGRKIAEMCRFFGIEYELVKPLTKVWKGRERKISAQEFNAVTGFKGRTNQEMRDAGLIAWVWAGLPLNINDSKNTRQ